jgi:acid phosphatase (class A)
MKKSLFLFCLPLLLYATVQAQPEAGNTPLHNYKDKEPLPPKDHYRTLYQLDKKPHASFAWMDTITYPAKEVATGTLAATMLRTVYLIEDVPSLLHISPPPANSSEQTRAELRFLLELQEKRDSVQVARYKKLAGIYHSPNNFNPLDPDYHRNFSSLFHVGAPLGTWYTYKNLPNTARFLSNVYRDASYYFFRLKVTINRPRPYMLEPSLKYLERPPHQSYPSGHAAASYANAYILSQIAPERADDFLQKAAEMAFSREVLGVHYPSDSEMGRLWARQFVNELFRKEAFRKDFEAARKEILDFRQKAATGNLIDKESAGEAPCSSACGTSCGSSCCKD